MSGNDERFFFTGYDIVPTFERKFTIDELIKYIPGFRFKGLVISISNGKRKLSWGREDGSLIFPGHDPESAKETMLRRLNDAFGEFWDVRIEHEGRFTEILTPCPALCWMIPPVDGKKRGEIQHEDMMEYIKQELMSWYKRDLSVNMED